MIINVICKFSPYAFIYPFRVLTFEINPLHYCANLHSTYLILEDAVPIEWICEMKTSFSSLFTVIYVLKCKNV